MNERRSAIIVALCLLAPAAHADRRVLTLKEALEVADANLPALRQAEADTATIAAQADEARAPLLPQLNGSAAYRRTTSNYVPQPGVTPGVSSSGVASTSTQSTIPTPTIATFNYWSFTASLTQTLFDAPTFSYWRSALASIGAQRATWDTARLDVALNVRNAFYMARADAALMQAAKETVKNQKDHLDQVQGYVTVGARPEIDLAQSKADLANAQVQLITAQNNYDTARATLTQSMGVAMDTDFDLQDADEPSVDLEDARIEEDVDVADKARPELKAFDERVRAEMLLLKSKEWQWAPLLQAQVNASDAGRDITGLGWNFNFQVGATWNFFNGLNSWSQVREIKATAASLRAQRDTERLQVRLELEKGRFAVRAGKASVISANEALKNARILLQLAQGRYKAGVGNAVELSDAILQLATSTAQQIQSTFNLSMARAQFLRALGRR